jgi:hypothetical protein
MKTWNQFLAWEKASNDTIDFKKVYVDVVGKKGVVGKKNGDIVSGLLLSQIVYWYLPGKDNKTKLREKRFGHYWIVKERSEWYEECRLTESNYKTAIKRLEEENLIEKRVFKPAIFGRKKTATCIRLNIPEFLRRLNLVMEHEERVQDTVEQEYEKYIAAQFDQDLENIELDQEDNGKQQMKKFNEPTFEDYSEQELKEESEIEPENNNLFLPNSGMAESTDPKDRRNQPILKNGEINRSLYITENKNNNKEFNSDNTLLSSSSIKKNNIHKKKNEEEEKKLMEIIKHGDNLFSELLFELEEREFLNTKKEFLAIVKKLIEYNCHWFTIKDIEAAIEKTSDAILLGKVDVPTSYFAKILANEVMKSKISKQRKQRKMAYMKEQEKYGQNEQYTQKRTPVFYNWLEPDKKLA